MSELEQLPDAPQGAAPDLSVLIPTHDRGPTLKRLLERLTAQTLAPDRFEVIVVDDGSPEPVVLEQQDFAFRLHLERQENAGPGAARNRGLEHCTAPLVLILNDDAVPAPELLATHLLAHDEAPVRCAVMGTFHFTEEARRHPFVRILDESDLLFSYAPLRHKRMHSWQFFWTCNLSLPVAALREVGGFDAERFPEAIVEDVELGYRLEQRGLHVLYREDAVCHHDHVLSPESYLRRSVRLGVFLTRMYEKHGDPRVLYCLTQDKVRELKHECADTVAQYQPLLEGLIRGLQKLDDEYFDRELPDDLQEQATTLVREISSAGFRRGIHLETTGIDLVQLAEVGPPRDLLTSVVVVSHEALGKTRRCIERLLATREEGFPIELIVVDNGSGDGSAEWLAQQSDVRLVSNEENLGAPHARNQAIALARGEWIAFFDNDVYVTDGWLSRALYHGAIAPAVGAVCLVSNRASKHQQVSYEGDASEVCIEREAAQRARDWARRGRDTDLFTSLGVLVRRAVVEQIGGFDERFSPWGFEDDDYSLRVRMAGFRCRVAQDVFVYHDHYDSSEKERRHQGLLHRNWERFADKWGSGAIPRLYDYQALNLDISSRRPPEELYVPLEQPEEPVRPTTDGVPVERERTPLPEPTASENRRSVLILGSGRSGTSMLAGTLAGGGWDVGGG
ncbi:MAG: glycosyltransferase, partial [Planctomycetota bacterium]